MQTRNLCMDLLTLEGEIEKKNLEGENHVPILHRDGVKSIITDTPFKQINIPSYCFLYASICS